MGRKPKDLTGQVFGKLTAIEPTQKRIGTSIVWKCQCECDGKIIEVPTNSLLSGNTTSCGCTRSDYWKGKKQKDLTGQHFGRLTALRPTEKRDANRSTIWECVCACDGKIVEKSAFNLLRGHALSCGCIQAGIEIVDISHMVFGKLEAIQPLDKRSGGHVVWLCKCIDCGHEVEVTGNHLKTGNTKWCPKCGNKKKKDAAQL